MAFLGGSNADVRLAGGTRRGTFCFECRRDDVAHVLPQKGLLGRNLITLFRCVNSFTKKKSRYFLGSSRSATGLRLRTGAYRHRHLRRCCRALFENTVIHAVSNLHRSSIDSVASCCAPAPGRCATLFPMTKRIPAAAKARCGKPALREPDCAEVRKLFGDRVERMRIDTWVQLPPSGCIEFFQNERQVRVVMRRAWSPMRGCRTPRSTPPMSVAALAKPALRLLARLEPEPRAWSQKRPHWAAVFSFGNGQAGG